MTVEKIKEVLAIYRQKLEEMNIPERQFPHDELTKENDDERILQLCHAMLDEMEIFLQQNKMEKLFRWLGFIQGCFWALGIYTINELRNHNRQ